MISNDSPACAIENQIAGILNTESLSESEIVSRIQAVEKASDAILKHLYTELAKCRATRNRVELGHTAREILGLNRRHPRVASDVQVGIANRRQAG